MARQIHNQRAFTLIELLVVIAIIAILAAILFPVFAQAKSSAKRTATLSSLKQAGLSVMMYQSDYDDVNPWHYGYVQGFPAQVYYNDTTWVHVCQPYAKNRNIYFDSTISEPKENSTTPDGRPAFSDPFYPTLRYRWGWAANLAMNADGFSTNNSETACNTSRSANLAMTNTRSATSIAEPASLMAITPNRYANLSYGWMYSQSRYAMTPFKDIYFTSDFSWFNLTWDARRQWGGRFNAVYADGHVGKYGKEKFLGNCWTPGANCTVEYSGAADFCVKYNANEDMKKFWGVWQ